LNANSAIFQLYMRWWGCPLCTTTSRWDGFL